MLKRIKENILKGDFKNIKDLVNEALKNNICANEIFKVMTSSIDNVGDKFGKGDLFLPELMASAQAMKEGVEILKPELARKKNTIKKIGRVLIGTNEGDIHDIGKALVILMLENAGFEVIDLGTDVPSEKFIEEAKKNKPDIIGMSALLTSTLMGQISVIKKLKEENIRNSFKVMVGGSPTTPEWAKEIGADGYGADANQAVVIAKRLLKIK